MIGQFAITTETKDVIVVVGKNPTWFDGKDQGDIPMVYTQNSRPKPNDMAMLQGKRVQLIHKSGKDEVFAKWYAEIINAKPSFLLAMDSQGEIFCN
jgi:hypothetical protein